MIASFVFAFFSTLGFSILFHVPKRHLISASFVGGCGWITFIHLTSTGSGKIIACFAGSCVVALISDIFSKGFKEAATIFTIPGILPLVPGAGMYDTMRAALASNFNETAAVGTETILMAGAIAGGLLIVASFFKIFSQLATFIQGLIRKRRKEVVE